MTEVAYIALGSNLGDRHTHLEKAYAELDQLAGSRIVAASDVEETAPLGAADQPAYLNQMIALETTLTPESLMTELLRIERAHGRVRNERWGSRTLDLDIVEFGNVTMNRPELRIPHPGLPDRDFWQRQLAQVKSR